MVTLNKGQYLSDVMHEIPTNSILSKRIPGCGATTLELNTNHNSIIIVPNVPVINSKCQKDENNIILGVYETVTVDDIVEYLNEHNIYKIMTTPESFPKVKKASELCGLNIYTDFFLLDDECHQLVKDVDYRADIVLPMDVNSRNYAGNQNDVRMRRGKNDSIYERLDQQFTFAQAMQQSVIEKGASVTQNSVQQMLKNWRNQGLIVQTNNDTFRKN